MSEAINQQNNGGVKTPEGKAVSRYNAQKHAILRETTTDYEKADAEQIFNDLADDLKPEGRLQELLVESISSNAIRLQRIAKAEAEMVKELMSKDQWLVLSSQKYAAEMPSEDADRLLIYSRYQTATENRIYRALAVYKQLKNYEQSQKTK